MTTMERIILLEKQLVNNNYDLINQVQNLPPADQKVYSEKVSRLIETVSELNKKVLLQTGQLSKK